MPDNFQASSFIGVRRELGDRWSNKPEPELDLIRQIRNTKESKLRGLIKQFRTLNI